MPWKLTTEKDGRTRLTRTYTDAEKRAPKADAKNLKSQTIASNLGTSAKT